MPKAIHTLAKKLEGKSGVKNPWGLATYLVKHKKVIDRPTRGDMKDRPRGRSRGRS